MTSIEPRLIRMRDAPRYLGMDRNRFNSEVRPHVTCIPIGKQGIAFDRQELDRWTDHYIALHGQRTTAAQHAATCETAQIKQRSLRLTMGAAGRNQPHDFAKDRREFEQALQLVTKRMRKSVSNL